MPDMVFVKGGTAQMGSNEYHDTKPVHNVTLSDFYIDKYEVTVKQYREFCNATGRAMPEAPSWGWHDDHPIVNVSWFDADSYANWVGKQLPTEAEWEYAARGNLALSMYPWGGPYIRNQLGCFVANFKPLRGNYIDDGALITERVGAYSPNEYGLYDMAGNVAEWTANAYDESAYVFSHNMNPDYKYNARPDDPPVMKRKVVRGGSWKDVAHYLQVSVRDYEYQDTSKSYVGFRCVRTYLGSN